MTEPEEQENVEEYEADLELYINVIEKFGPNGKPALILRKILSNKYEVQYILNKALKGEVIIAKIKIKNKYLAIPKLARLGLLDPDEL